VIEQRENSNNGQDKDLFVGVLWSVRMRMGETLLVEGRTRRRACSGRLDLSGPGWRFRCMCLKLGGHGRK
jgi:hypothetical protein